MAAFWMCEIAPTEIAESDAFHHNRRAFRRALKVERASRVGQVTSQRRKLRVLVVGDNHDATNALARHMNRWDHSSRSAYDGVSALRIAAVQHPDVVLVDITLPRMGGYQVARQLRLDFSEHDCFIIALAPDGEESTRQRCLDAGIDMVLIKSVEPCVLETLLMLECERINRSSYAMPPELHKQGVRLDGPISKTGLALRL